jgi:hypothetical protein
MSGDRSGESCAQTLAVDVVYLACWLDGTDGKSYFKPIFQQFEDISAAREVLWVFPGAVRIRWILENGCCLYYVIDCNTVQEQRGSFDRNSF